MRTDLHRSSRDAAPGALGGWARWLGLLACLLAARWAAAQEGAPAAAPAEEAATAPNANEQTAATETTDELGFGFDLFPYVGTSTRHADATRDFSFNLMGLSAGTLGAEIGLLMNIDTRLVHGVQIAGAVNWTEGLVDGFQAAGALNLATRGVDGLQLGGGLNVASGPLDGYQLAGGLNVATGRMDGLQAAGGLDVASNSAHGVQLQGGAGIVSGDLDGVQISGGVNITTGRVDGGQAAALNVAAGDAFRGLQLGAVDIVSSDATGAQIGALNIVPGRIHGGQIGALNIARHSDFSLGGLSIAWAGRVQIAVWGSDPGFMHVAVVHGDGWWHGIYGASYRPGADSQSDGAWALVGGWGGRIHTGSPLYVDIDVLSQTLSHKGSLPDEVHELNSLRAAVNYPVVPWLSVMAGLSYNVFVSKLGSGGDLALGLDTLYTSSQDDVQVRGWPGFFAGVSFIEPRERE